jgi:hypothetical protein
MKVPKTTSRFSSVAHENNDEYNSNPINTYNIKYSKLWIDFNLFNWPSLYSDKDNKKIHKKKKNQDKAFICFIPMNKL